MLVSTMVKFTGSFMVTTSITAATKFIVKNITPDNATKITKVAIKVGWFIIGTTAAQAVTSKFIKEVDTVREMGKQIKKTVENRLKEETIESEEETIETEAE